MKLSPKFQKTLSNNEMEKDPKNTNSLKNQTAKINILWLFLFCQKTTKCYAKKA